MTQRNIEMVSMLIIRSMPSIMDIMKTINLLGANKGVDHWSPDALLKEL